VNFEQLLVKYLYQQKQLSLQGFGTITLNNSVPDADIISKNKQIPIEGVSFLHNTKAVTDPGFVQFFSQQKGKIKPLAESDIESHLQLAKQLMNIGKPYEVEGLGMFAIKQDGSIVLHVGHYSMPANDTGVQSMRMKERTQEDEKREVEQDGGGIGNGVKKAAIAIAVILVLLAGGWFIWSKIKPQTEAPPLKETIGLVNADTVPLPIDTAVKPLLPAADSAPVWKAYFRTFKGSFWVDSMKIRYRRLDTALHIETLDSNTFRLFLLVKKPVADTARLKDSLENVLKRVVTLERTTQ
jgi:hypothetical protein